MKAVILRGALPAACLALLTACTAVRSRDVLVLFFDGVPARPTVDLPRADLVSPGDAAPVPKVPALYLAARAAPPGFRHQPYAERDCLTCHESQFSQKMRGPVTEICRQCHQPIFAPRHFSHAPAAEGGCLECHRPHESLQPALLALPGNGVCFECHEENRVGVKPAHAAHAGEACSRCHDPHGGERRYFLKDAPPAAVAPAAASVP